jgi:hypothetical protein
MYMRTVTLTEKTPELDTFIQECDRRGYGNNCSYKAMKFDWCLDTGGMWFASQKDSGEIVAVSGVHPFDDGYRALFRGVQIEERDFSGLTKYQLRNHCFAEHLPYAIEYAGNNPIYVTTSPYAKDDRSGTMQRIHKSAEILAKQGVFEFVEQREVFYVQQVIWILNRERYNEIKR